jgi:hypothetical protein
MIVIPAVVGMSFGRVLTLGSGLLVGSGTFIPADLRLVLPIVLVQSRDEFLKRL